MNAVCRRESKQGTTLGVLLSSRRTTLPLEKSVSVFFSYHDVDICTSWTEFATGTEGNELSAGRKEIKAIELERCLMSSECIGWLRHVYLR